jgi:hypothetical protein
MEAICTKCGKQERDVPVPESYTCPPCRHARALADESVALMAPSLPWVSETGLLGALECAYRRVL